MCCPEAVVPEDDNKEGAKGGYAKADAAQSNPNTVSNEGDSAAKGDRGVSIQEKMATTPTLAIQCLCGMWLIARGSVDKGGQR